MPPVRKAEAERFWSKVKFTDTCWLWTGAKRNGYGAFYIGRDGMHMVRAHRWAYESCVGPIPGGFTLDHLCRVRNCVRFDHLEPVTNRVNVLRGVGISAEKARQTHCWHGHEFNEGNTHIRPDGTRACRACRNVRSRAWRRRKGVTRQDALMSLAQRDGAPS